MLCELIYLLRKVVCFFDTLKSPKAQCTQLCSWFHCKALKEGVHQGDFIMFRLMMLRVVEYGIKKNKISIKSKLKFLLKFLGVFLVLLKSPKQLGFCGGEFVIFRLKL